MPFHILINSDVEVSLMSLQVFSILQIPISSLTTVSPVRGPSDNIVETHRNIMLLVPLAITEDF
jgi:hypothetical protein